jgi:metal-dependent amidase/aminoacylase/carboxypeptidase family protein
MIEEGVMEDYAPEEVHALHCGPMPVGVFAINPGSGLPGQDRGSVVLTGADAAGRADRLAEAIGALNTVARPQTSADIEQLLADVQIPNGPLSEFVFMRATPVESTEDRAVVQVVYRCWPEKDYTAVRKEVARIAAEDDAAVAEFPTDPFPALVCPERDALAVGRHLRRTMGRDSAAVMRAAFPFNGEDFGLFLDEAPGTYTYLGVRNPEADITTALPHLPSFEADERAIGYGVRAMAGWLSQRSWRD